MQKRLRIFAGPNGSGKSTLKERIVEKYVDLGVYVNADEIKKGVETYCRIDFKDYRLNFDKDDFIKFIHNSTLIEKIDNIEDVLSDLTFQDTAIVFDKQNPINDYLISLITSYIWERLLEESKKFTVETVMSHVSKIDFIKKAQDKGFKVYLYFVSLADPRLNVLRVNARVSGGGHQVAEDKIITRYARSMDNLFEALKRIDTCYIFDNSTGEPKLIATKEKGELTVQTDYIPVWYKKYVEDKF